MERFLTENRTFLNEQFFYFFRQQPSTHPPINVETRFVDAITWLGERGRNMRNGDWTKFTSREVCFQAVSRLLLLLIVAREMFMG